MSTLLLPPGITADCLAAALRTCERIAGKDRSNLYVVSQFFEDRARYDAFIAMYSVMRVVDDFVDDIVDKSALPQSEVDRLLAELDRWERRIRAAYEGRPLSDPLDVALAAAVMTFPVPLRLWLAFIDAMRFDVCKPRFEDFGEFLAYGEGATVAPTSIYVYLLASRRRRDGQYFVIDFDFETCGRDLGRFAYIAHVLRDVRADLAVGTQGLVYLSKADMRLHGLGEPDLRELVNGSATESTHQQWRGLVHDICVRAQSMRRHGTDLAREVWDTLPADCAFIFRLIVGMYAELLDRIDADPDCVLRGESVLTEHDKFAVLRSAADASGFQPEAIGPNAA